MRLRNLKDLNYSYSIIDKNNKRTHKYKWDY